MVIQTLPKTVIPESRILSSPSEYYKAFILRKTRQTAVLLTEALDAGFRGQMYTSRPYEVFDRVNKSLWRTLKETPMNTGNSVGCSINFLKTLLYKCLLCTAIKLVLLVITHDSDVRTSKYY